MAKAKKEQAKTPKPVLASKITKRKSLKRSAAITPKMKKLSVRQAKNEFIRGKLDFSESTDSLQSADEIKPKQNDILSPGHFVKTPKSPIDLTQVENGVKALFEYVEKTRESKTELFDDEQPVFLQIGCIKVPKTPSRQIRLLLKHSLLPESSEICLIVNDVGKAKEHEETVEHYEKLLQAKGITNIKTIMPYHQFKTEYGNQYELKRKLVNLYDCFLIDARASGYVAHSTGKIFMQKRKVPIPVRMNATSLKEHFEKSLHKTVLSIHSKSDSFSVQVGHTKMSQNKVFENVSSIIDELFIYFPGGSDNIRSLGIKTDKSIVVPIFLSLKNKREVRVPIVKAKRPKQYQAASGELTTYITKDVTVLPTGEVTLVDHEAGNLSGEEPFELESDLEEQFESVDDEDDILEDGEDEDSAEFSGEEESDEKDAKVKEMKQTNQEEPASDYDEDQDDFLNEAEEIYLNHYEQERTTAKKTKKVNETKTGNEITALKKSKIQGKEKEDVNIPSTAKKGAKKMKQKDTQTQKEEIVKIADSEDVLAKAEELYMTEYKQEQEQTAVKKTRKAKAKTENKAVKEKRESQKKAVKASKTSAKKGKKDLTDNLNQQEPTKPQKKSKKRKISEKAAAETEVAVSTTRQTRKSTANNADEEIPNKKSKKNVDQISESTKSAAENKKTKIVSAESKTKNKVAKISKGTKEKVLPPSSEQKVEEKGKKKANKATKSKVPENEVPEKASKKVTGNQATKSTANTKKSKKTDEAGNEETSKGKKGKEKKVKSPPPKVQAKKVKKLAPKKDVLKVKL